MNSRLEKIVVGITILFVLSAIPSLVLQWSMAAYPKSAAIIYTLAAFSILISGISLFWRRKNYLRYAFLFGVFVSAFGFVSGDLAIGLFGLVNFPFSIGSVTASGHREGIFLNLPLVVPFLVVGAQAGKAMWEA